MKKMAFDLIPYIQCDSTEGIYYKIPYDKAIEFEKSLDHSVCCKTDLKGWWKEPLEIVGQNKSWTFFKLGTDEGELFPHVYYIPIFIIDPNQIFLMYNTDHGRNYIYKNGKWK